MKNKIYPKIISHHNWLEHSYEFIGSHNTSEFFTNNINDMYIKLLKMGYSITEINHFPMEFCKECKKMDKKD